MKKIFILTLCLAFLSLFVKSQTSDYYDLISYLKTHSKENTENRLIAVNMWSVSDKNSRDANTDLNNAINVFKNAKLKGGNKGIIGIIICTDNDDVSANIALKKEGITNVVTINASELSSFPELSKRSSSYNIVFDSEGNMVYENLQSNSVFSSIRNLITR